MSMSVLTSTHYSGCAIRFPSLTSAARLLATKPAPVSEKKSVLDFEMRPSPSLLVQVIRRSALQVEERKVIPALKPQTLELARPSLIDMLQKQKEAAGADWPPNLRIEPIIKKEMLKDVQKEIRPRLKKLLQER